MAESKLVIGIAGRIGSGKTALGHFLESHLGFLYLRYSLVLAEWRNADPAAKSRLQDLGWGVMCGDHQAELNRRLISHIHHEQDCVVDGLRHLVDYESLKTRFRATFFLVYLDVPANIRFTRLRGRFSNYEQFLNADSHPVESNLEQVRSVANIVLDGTVALPELAPKVTTWVNTLRLP